MVGAFGPALKAGSPVTGSVTIFIRCGRFLRGVSTIRPSSIFASRGSPGWIQVGGAAALAERLVPWSIPWFAW